MTETIGSPRKRALVVYESMYGNTDSLAHAIATGIEALMAVTVVNVNHTSPTSLLTIDFLVVGAPTHIHGLSRQSTRDAAISSASVELPLDVDAVGRGVREWLAEIDTSARYFAAFDTRIDMPRWMTGAAAPHISRLLRSRGLESLVTPESFLVTDKTTLVPAELSRAEQWGRDVGLAASARLTG
jgi:hypothetical protein